MSDAPVFPPLEPFESGHLRMKDGNEICWELSGLPTGKPVVCLHGGPGGGAGAGFRRHFDPAAHLIVAFDQRGCGRSRPWACHDRARLVSNTTQAIIADMEALRVHLGIGRWTIMGKSWGTALGLAYAQAHPERVREMVLALIHIPSAEVVDWITEHLRRVFPREWEALAAAVPRRPGQRMIDACHEGITHDDPAVREATARAWCRWEDVHVSLDPCPKAALSLMSDESQLNLATLTIHYWRHAGFLAERPLLENMHRIAHLPAVLIHGRLDISSPMSDAVALHRRWPGSELIVIPDEGHGGPRMADEINRAVARFLAADGL